MLDTSDIDLVKRAQDGDIHAVGALYDRHQRRIFRYVWARTGSVQTAEDLTGEVFSRMLQGLSTYKMTGVPFAAWLYRMAHNLIVDHYRKENHQPVVPLEQAEDVQAAEWESPMVVVERRLTAERVQQALTQLDPSQQKVVVLRFLVGMSLKDVASTLDKTVAAIKSLQHRGLMVLREILAHEIPV